MTLSKLKIRPQKIAVLLPLLWGIGRAQADQDIPALLQFAEQYRAPKTHDVQENAPAVTLSDSPRHRAQKNHDTELMKQQITIRRLEKQTAYLREALKAEKERQNQAHKIPESDSPANERQLVDLAPLHKLITKFRHALIGHPDEKRALELISEAREATFREKQAVADAESELKTLKHQVKILEQQLIKNGAEVIEDHLSMQSQKTQNLELQEQLNEKNAELARLQKWGATSKSQSDDLLAQLKVQKDSYTALDQRQEKLKADWETEINSKLQQIAALEKKGQDLQLVNEQSQATVSALQGKYAELQKQQDTLEKQVSDANDIIAQQSLALKKVETDAEELRTRAKWLAKPQTLSKPSGRQDYAAGAALGRDILAMLNERKGWGINTDQPTLLAGVVDALAGKYQLEPDVMSKALTESESAVNKGRQKALSIQQEKGEKFVADFRKKKGVKQSPSGFWYVVGYAGDTRIEETDIVDIVVEEKLTDGTVIQDMAASGTVLSQPLSEYPVLFREAIGYLGNHGSLTMVVPPDLAYGEKGYPPKVPPNATMVYEVRIDNSGKPKI